nr:MAG: ORF1 [Torque teno midi virus]
MPFWWRRRKRWWNPTWRKRRYNAKRKYKRRRQYSRRRRRRAPRRRYRRRTKVRRKRKTLTLKQWQPDCIRKCKIKGTAVHVLGGEGRQFACYSDNRFAYTPPLQPGGGGFGVEKFSLQYAYEENRRGNNIWTQSNKLLDLARYTGTKIRFYRHQHTDFIVSYSRQWPFTLERYTYPDTHPFELIKSKHKKFIPSMITNPHKKRYVTIKIRPPKQLQNKWYFQESIAHTPLFLLRSSIADLRYPHIGPASTNQQMSFAHLNLNFYQYPGWGNNTNPTTPTDTTWYRPYPRSSNIKKVRLPNGKEVQVTMSDRTSEPTIYYKETTSYEKGWFQPTILQAVKIIDPAEMVLPVSAARYNPTRDDGVGNAIWLVNITKGSYSPPTTDKTLYLDNLPLWQLLWGFFDYVQKLKGDPTFLQTYYLCIKSKYIEPAHALNNTYIVLDNEFIQGQGPFGSYVTEYRKSHWYPTLNAQLKTVNNFVKCGPFVPNYDTFKNSSWELYSSYTMYFKFGGAALPEPDTANPEEQGDFDIPTNLKQTLQISNPQKISSKSTIHTWDLRRGIVTSSAFKRMCENQETDTDFQTDTEEPPQKKACYRGNNLLPQEKETQEIQNCLQELCEESSCPDYQEETNLQHLINKQQQQQQQLKNNILKLILDLKKKQKILQLQTGVLD